MTAPLEAYPLTWPTNRPRTPPFERQNAKFDTSFSRARDEVAHQVQLLVGRYAKSDMILSTNLALRRDGLPLAAQRKTLEDPGVAVYFTYRKKPMCFACDRWLDIADNMQAVSKTIEALRGIARWGTGDMMEAAFTGFLALPAPGQASARDWREVFGFAWGYVHPSQLHSAYVSARAKAHPDRPGGSPEAFHEVQVAFENAKRELGVATL